jgi:two-component system nitrate/nitrite response regulator NarL
MNDKKINTVLIIDDHPLFRKGVIELLNSQPDFEVIGEAASGEEGVGMAVELNPDIVLTDLNMKGMGGINVVKAIRNTELQSFNIILTVSDTEENLLTALRSGADGYLLKDTEPEMIIDKLRSSLKGEIVVDESLTRLVTNTLRDTKRWVPNDQNILSERETEIIKLILRGMSNKLIARELGITEGTVKVHVKNLLRKLNLKSRLEAALWAIEHGFTDQNT